MSAADGGPAAQQWGGRRSGAAGSRAGFRSGGAYGRNSPSISDIRRISMTGSRAENGWKPNFA